MLIIAETDALIARLEAALDPAGRAGFRAAEAAPCAARGEFLRRVAAKLETRRPEEIGVGPLTLTDRHFSTRRARSKKFCRSSRMSSGGEAAAAPGDSLHDQSPYRRGARWHPALPRDRAIQALEQSGANVGQDCRRVHREQD
jgi:hypothetical protein